MSNPKNFLDLNSGSNPKKITYSSAHVDSLPKKNKKQETNTKFIEPKVEIVAESKLTNESVDDNKRLFLKIAGIAGIGMAASALFPKGAEAYVAGSTPTSNVVGSKNVANTRINPATEDTLALMKARTDLLTFDAGTNPANLKVNVAAGDIGILNVANAVINPATEDTLALIKAQSDKLTFDVNNNLSTISGIKDSLGNRMTPAQDDSVVLLRRIVKLMESQAVVDSGNRQRMTLDSLGTGTAITTTVPISGSLTTAGTVSTVSSVTNIAAIAGQNQQMFQDVARNTYANGIRNNLIWS